MQRFGRGRGRDVDGLGAAVQDADPGARAAGAHPGRGLAHLRARLRPLRRGRRRGQAGAADGELAGAPGRRGLRPAAAGRQPGDRGDRERLRLRARPGDRAGDLAQARRHPGAAVRPAVRQHRPARHHRHAGLQPGQRAGLRRGRDLGIPPRAGRASRCATARPGGARHPRPRTGSRGTTSSGPRSAIAGRAGVRGVRRAVRRLRSVPRLGGGHPAQRQRAADLLRGADPARGRRLGHRGPGHRPGRHHVRQRGQRLGDQHQLRRQRLGDRAVPRAAPDRRLRADHLGR